jgi:hypothetical protein
MQTSGGSPFRRPSPESASLVRDTRLIIRFAIPYTYCEFCHCAVGPSGNHFELSATR